MQPSTALPDQSPTPVALDDSRSPTDDGSATVRAEPATLAALEASEPEVQHEARQSLAARDAKLVQPLLASLSSATVAPAESPDRAATMEPATAVPPSHSDTAAGTDAEILAPRYLLQLGAYRSESNARKDCAAFSSIAPVAVVSGGASSKSLTACVRKTQARSAMRALPGSFAVLSAKPARSGPNQWKNRAARSKAGFAMNE